MLWGGCDTSQFGELVVGADGGWWEDDAYEASLCYDTAVHFSQYDVVAVDEDCNTYEITSVSADTSWCRAGTEYIMNALDGETEATITQLEVDCETGSVRLYYPGPQISIYRKPKA